MNEVLMPNRNNVIAHETVISNMPNQRAKSDGNNKNNVYDKSSYSSNNVRQDWGKAGRGNYKNYDNTLHSSYTGPLDQIVKTNLKLEEFKILLNKHYPPYQASQFLKFVTYMVTVGGHDTFLDKVLGYLRGDVVKAFPGLFDDTLLQPLSDKKVDQQISPESYLQGKIKLEAIERLLSPHCPKEFVRNVITGLSNMFDVTGNLSELDQAFEDHRKNVERYYMRY